ncbi:hypothetical protein CGRA01v4_10507 [Colletotrichum graminicola]|uniref:Uncharacterized protein n=1 Tax=Colletotrichum graminicola (strain M1.001 / M2 / FGSC 10212) TaxID=645133 RepID=E3QK36_COLGM|nr:uncharacterized protein GLRG_06368 [Colletotrichum graminicola M1.001]EFQ31224.1 hypothetical protein GLRG_06368 [Colletotrichum graminicola M1.001]WDK19220.1 hypothetical protein CGRA01v4_10507 [Colletotrichum graminicola]
MSFRVTSDVDRPKNVEEFMADMTGGNMAVVRWKHTPEGTAAFDDAAAFGTIRSALLEQNNDPRRLRRVAVEIAALLPPAHRPSDDDDDDVLGSLWRLFVSLAQQTPSGNLAMLDLVVILDHLSSSPKTTATVTVDGFEQLSRLHGLNQSIRDSMVSPYQSPSRADTLARWVGLNAFAALLWSYNLIDGRDFAVRQLRAAFEDRRSSDAGDRDGADARLMAAAQWAVHSCQRLYHLSVTSEGGGGGPDGNGNGNGNGKGADAERWKPGPRFRGRAGFSFRRWEFWQQAFEEADEFGNGGIEAKVEARAAAGVMEKVLYAGFEG